MGLVVGQCGWNDKKEMTKMKKLVIRIAGVTIISIFLLAAGQNAIGRPAKAYDKTKMPEMKYAFGVDYYAECWPEQLWDKDIELMAAANMNIVRLADFAWSRVETAPGRFDFSWLDKVIEKIGSRGMKVVLGTSTAGPPYWLVKRYPGVSPVDYEGHSVRYYGRGDGAQYSYYNPDFLRCVERLVTAMARHYKDNPYVYCWQVDNELNWEDNLGYDTYTKQAFREWLQKKYKTIADLNKIYGNALYIQEYDDWGEVEPPVPPFSRKLPGLALDWLRFRSETLIKYTEFQRSLIKSQAPAQPVTTNQMAGFFGRINYYDMGKVVDFVANDLYPKWVPHDSDPVLALSHDGNRNMAETGNFWLMETQSGALPGAKTPRPGELRKFAYQAISRGANGILYFRWRANPAGHEQFCIGIFDHDNRMNRKYEEVQNIGRELSNFADVIMDTDFRAQAAILYSYDSRWSTEIDPYFNTTYVEEIYNTYKALWTKRIPTDVISPENSFDGYKVLFVPFGYLVDSSLALKLTDYVRGGGMLISTARLAVKDEFNRVFTEPLPGLLSGLFGMTIKGYDFIAESEDKGIVMDSASDFPGVKRLRAKSWIDIPQPAKARVIGTHSGDFTDGKPAVTVNDYGKGKAVYIGAFLAYEDVAKLVEALINTGRIKPFAVTTDTDEQVEIVKRWGKNYEVLFVINHSGNDRSVEIDLQKQYSIKELTGDFTATGKIFRLNLPPDDVKIFLLR